MLPFSARISIIGVNPYVIPPQRVLTFIFRDAGVSKGAIPVKGTLDGHGFHQTLVKYNGKWRLYLNTPMRKKAGLKVGDRAAFRLAYDGKPRPTPMHPKFKAALRKNAEAKKVFDGLSPSRQKEINRYINHLKSKEALTRNIKRAIGFLQSRDRFIGRDKP